MRIFAINCLMSRPIEILRNVCVRPNMTAILDTSFLFALTDKSDRNHERVLAVAQKRK